MPGPEPTLVLDALAVEVLVVDAADGRILDVNQTACTSLGYSRDEIVGMHLSQIEVKAPVAGEEPWRRNVDEIRRNDGRLVVPGRHRRKDGSTLPVVVSLVLQTLGGRERIVASAIDVTVTHALKAELGNVESRALAMVQAMPDFCFLVSKDGRFLEAYTSTDELLAMPRSAFLGKRFEETLSPELARTTRASVEKVLATGKLDVFDYDMPVGGRPRRWEARIVKRSDDDALILCRDVTELRLAEIRLVETARLVSLGELAASLSHELRTPLSAIVLNVDLLKQAVAKGEPSGKLAALTATLDRLSSRMTAIVHALSTFGRKAETDPFVSVPARALVDDALALCREAFSTHEVAVTATVPEDLMLECHPARIVQILLNLLTNALDAVEPVAEKWCRIAVEADEERVTLTVTDSGRGVPAELRPRLMQPFFTTKDPGKGTGLGLSISRRLAEEHGGTLSFDAGEPHTCFRLTLPRRRPPR